MKVIVNNDVVKVYKSADLKYLLNKRFDWKKEYSKDQVEFKIVASNVITVKKPRYVSFNNLPDWEQVIYGVNSDDDYYMMNIDTDQVRRLIRG